MTTISTISRGSRQRDRIREALTRMGENTLLRRAIRAIRWTRKHPRDTAAQMNRNLIWAELFRRGQESIFSKALAIVRRKENQAEIKRLQRMRREKAK